MRPQPCPASRQPIGVAQGRGLPLPPFSRAVSLRMPMPEVKKIKLNSNW